MDTAVRPEIVLLFDDYSKDSKRLHTSFKLAKSNCDVVVINEDGFLPEDVNSVYEYFLGDFSKYDTYLGRPRFFNQIEMPRFWETNASMSKGNVYELNKERARIYFINTSDNKRRVKVVEWLDNNDKVRLSDHYNKYGVLYARTSFSAKGERVNKIYYSSNMSPVIYENFTTGAIILNCNNEERIFSNKAEFVTYYMKLRGYEQGRIYFNSLWYSFFVSERLSSDTKDDILFWQEDARDDVPGNMKIILDGKATRTQIIVVQKKEAYDKLIELGVSPAFLRLKGFIYPFERENEGRTKVLIATNSDQIEHLEDLIKALPEVDFNVVAITTMSSKLHDLESYSNISLYPGVETDVLDDLFKECDMLLDINNYNEICDATYRAFLNNMVIMAFDSTMHNGAYTATESIYKTDDWEKMVSDIKEIFSDKSMLEKRLELQRQHGLSETERSYALLK